MHGCVGSRPVRLFVTRFQPRERQLVKLKHGTGELGGIYPARGTKLHHMIPYKIAILLIEVIHHGFKGGETTDS
jgi:hypothetical protein